MEEISEKEIALNNLREIRQRECYKLYNRRFDKEVEESAEKMSELDAWKKKWDDITDIIKSGGTMKDVVIPTMPTWLK